MNKLALMVGAAALAAGGPALAKPHGHNHAISKHGKVTHGVVVSDRYGRLYALDARGSCPPGLARKHNGCMPPGHAKRLYRVGQRYNRNFGTLWTYNQIPNYLRSQYTFDPYSRYYYNSGYLYQVDPRTMLIQQVISALLR